MFRLLFNFQDTDVTSTLRRATLLSYHTFCFLSSLFRDIFCRPLFIGQLIHNTTFFIDCQGVFSKFEAFCELLHIHQKPACFFVHSVKQTHKSKKKNRTLCSSLKAPTGFEPVIKVLQTYALPLGYSADMERITRLELATSTLARWRSTR